VLTRENIVEVIKFAHREKLFIFADEVCKQLHHLRNFFFTLKYFVIFFSRFIKTMCTPATGSSILSRKSRGNWAILMTNWSSPLSSPVPKVKSRLLFFTSKIYFNFEFNRHRLHGRVWTTRRLLGNY
jgi:hypothetical protein